MVETRTEHSLKTLHYFTTFNVHIGHKAVILRYALTGLIQAGYDNNITGCFQFLFSKLLTDV